MSSNFLQTLSRFQHQSSERLEFLRLYKQSLFTSRTSSVLKPKRSNSKRALKFNYRLGRLGASVRGLSLPKLSIEVRHTLGNVHYTKPKISLFTSKLKKIKGSILEFTEHNAKVEKIQEFERNKRNLKMKRLRESLALSFINKKEVT